MRKTKRDTTTLPVRLLDDEGEPAVAGNAEPAVAGIGEGVGVPEEKGDAKPYSSEPATENTPPAPVAPSWEREPSIVEDTPEALAAHLSPAETSAAPGPTVQDTPGAGGGGKGKRKEKSAGVSPEDRAQAAFMGGAMLEQGLSILAGLVGSRITPRSLMEEQHATATTRAASGAAPSPFATLFETPGTPLDLNAAALARADFRNLIVREVSVVLAWREGQGWVPLRFALGVPVLSEEERTVLCESMDSPVRREGSLLVLTEPATIAHAIAAQLADGADATTKALAEFVEKYQTEIRLAYAGALLAWFMVLAWRDGAERREGRR